MPLKDDIKTLLNAQGDPPIYACRAWGSFNGTGTPAILGGGNLLSITDLGVGLYRANLIVALPSINLAVLLGVRKNLGDDANMTITYGSDTRTQTTTQIPITTGNPFGGNLADSSQVNFAVIG